jgi:hypothetical protein
MPAVFLSHATADHRDYDLAHKLAEGPAALRRASMDRARQHSGRNNVEAGNRVRHGRLLAISRHPLACVTPVGMGPRGDQARQGALRPRPVVRCAAAHYRQSEQAAPRPSAGALPRRVCRPVESSPQGGGTRAQRGLEARKLPLSLPEAAPRRPEALDTARAWDRAAKGAQSAALLRRTGRLKQLLEKDMGANAERVSVLSELRQLRQEHAIVS